MPDCSQHFESWKLSTPKKNPKTKTRAQTLAPKYSRPEISDFLGSLIRIHFHVKLMLQQKQKKKNTDTVLLFTRKIMGIKDNYRMPLLSTAQLRLSFCSKVGRCSQEHPVKVPLTAMLKKRRQSKQYIYTIPNWIFLVRFGGTSCEFGGVVAGILARHSQTKISMVISNEPNMLPKPTKKGGLIGS